MALIAIAGCSSIELPSPTPPPPWGAPISGGTLLVTRDGARAVVADPDRDRVVVVELDSGRALAELDLPAGSEPGRVVEDGAGHIHVALRGANELLTIDGAFVPTHRHACTEPRGVAWDPATDLVHVACTSGELVSMPAPGGDAVRTLVLDRDLRDVVVRGSQLVVTRFRTAELITLDAQGAIVSRAQPPVVQRLVGEPVDGSGSGSDGGIGSGGGPREPVDTIASVAWRTAAMPDGSLVTVHQRKVGTVLRLTPGGYGGTECGQGLIEAAITVLKPDGSLVAAAPYVRGALPVDIAVDPSGARMAVVVAGASAVLETSTALLGETDDNECGVTNPAQVRSINDQLGAPTSVAYRPNGQVVVFYPEYPALVVHASDGQPRTITLPGDIGYDSGRALFHAQTGAGLACASCHPEARDDGQVWVFDPLGARRTQNLAGGILSRAPYHWGGDMTDLGVLMQNVFAQRMFGGAVTNSQLVSLGPWLDRVPAPQPGSFASADAIARGRDLFLSQDLGCASCHVGPQYTNNAMVDVGTGGPFKVPSLLGVAVRAPFMHDGCAATLADRFGTCGGGDAHGKTSTLTADQLADLIAFLESI